MKLAPKTLVFLAALALAFPAAAPAGQIRVNVSNFQFTPAAASANVGDHIVWIWTGGSHTVTSGDFATVADPDAGDGHFNSSPGGVAISGATFSWKVDFTGVEPYYCRPHAPGMAGSLTLSSTGATGQSDFRLSEVQFNLAGELDLIEIANLGSAGNLGMYRLSVNGVAAQVLKKAASTDILVPSGGRVVVHLNQAGTTTDTDVFLPGIAGLPASGSAALYVPNTVLTALTRADQMIDFVQWGAAGQGNEPTAAAAGLWAAGTAVTGVASGHSIEFCGLPGQYGIAQWHEISTPNFGTNGNCATPASRTTWGRIKALHR